MDLYYRGLIYRAYAFSLFIPQAKTTCKYRGVTYAKSPPLDISVQPVSTLKYRGVSYQKQSFDPVPKQIIAP